MTAAAVAACGQWAALGPSPAAGGPVPPSAFRVSPKVMQRFRGGPPVVVEEAPPAARERTPDASENKTGDDPEDEPHTAEVTERPSAPRRPAPVRSVPPALPVAPSSGLAAPAPEVAAPAPKLSAVPKSADGSGAWAPAAAVEERPWRWVIVHHTATAGGSVEAIHAQHRKRRDSGGQPWLGIGYHFLIGNGDGMPDGAVEPTFRWRDQLSGAHAGRRAENDRGVGVCLVGDFTAADPTPAQLQSARRLVAFLQARYRIPADRVVPHHSIKATACPGDRLPVTSLLAAAASTARNPAATPPGDAVRSWGQENESEEDGLLPSGLSDWDPPALPAPGRELLDPLGRPARRPRISSSAPFGPGAASPRSPASPRRFVVPSPPRSGSQDAP